MDRAVRAWFAELLGTFVLVFISAGVVCAAYLPLEMARNVLAIAVAQGLALAVTLSVTVPAAGGYLNPAVTIVLWVLRRLDNRQAASFIFAQLLGGVLAGLALRLIFASGVLIPAHFGTPHVGAAFGPPGTKALAEAAGVELLLTFILTFAIFGTMIDPRAPRLSGVGVGAVVGLCLAALVLVGYDLTGVGLNPARSLGTAVWEWTYEAPAWREQVLVYCVGPVAGALLAGLVYSYLILPPEAGPPARPAK
jgi:MIP family channel proteins